MYLLLVTTLFIYRWLTLKGNKLSHLPENFNLQNLVHLNLSNNCFSKIPFEISHPKTLNYCILKANTISHVTKTELAHMKHIFKIDLQDNPLQCYEKLIVSTKVYKLFKCKLHS